MANSQISSLDNVFAGAEVEGSVLDKISSGFGLATVVGPNGGGEVQDIAPSNVKNPRGLTARSGGFRRADVRHDRLGWLVQSLLTSLVSFHLAMNLEHGVASLTLS